MERDNGPLLHCVHVVATGRGSGMIKVISGYVRFLFLSKPVGLAVPLRTNSSNNNNTGRHHSSNSKTSRSVSDDDGVVV